ncbi:MAG: 16S rRNA (adenine(1518)-N(6)/adenine(1519)-N(6))-dimethyltransferase RsmA [Eubacteriales bacterium]|nr:16S rRNA (adenine(1518)-N(6)/adenine(1519)-N(6))-dimethyltransferase RsmA [Eubacteriales bacterium]
MKLKRTKALLAEFQIQPTHSLGQNFLVDEDMVAQIGDLADLSPADTVLEIGPGLGHLTVELARRAGHVVAVEIDQHILPALARSLELHPNVTVIHADALKSDLRLLLSDHHSPSVKVVANLPYYVTTELLLKLMLEVPECKGLWLMMQKEAADRLAAEPGTKDYGPVGIVARSLGQIKRGLLVGRESFYPQPHIDSAILEVIPDPPATRKIQPQDLANYAEFVQNCFRQRRKTLVNSFTPTRFLSVAFDKGLKLVDLLEQQGIRRDIRPEVVTPAQFIQLYYSIIEFSKTI